MSYSRLVEKFSKYITKNSNKFTNSSRGQTDIIVEANKSKMIEEKKKGELVLDSSLIGRIFDNVPGSFFPNITSKVETFKAEMSGQDSKEGLTLLDHLLSEAREELLTASGQLRPEVVTFLADINSHFAKYDTFTSQQKEALHSALIYSLAHSQLTVIQKEYQKKYVGDYKLEEERKISDLKKEVNQKSLDRIQELNWSTLKDQKTSPAYQPALKELQGYTKKLKELKEREDILLAHNTKMTSMSKPSVDFMIENKAKIEDKIKSYETRKQKALESFIDLCMNAQREGTLVRKLDEEAKKLNDEFKLGLNMNIVRKKGFFQQNATTLLLSDQLLALIGNHYQPLVISARERCGKKQLTNSERLHIGKVLVKTGRTKQLEEFDTQQRQRRASTSGTSSEKAEVSSPKTPRPRPL